MAPIMDLARYFYISAIMFQSCAHAAFQGRMRFISQGSIFRSSPRLQNFLHKKCPRVPMQYRAYSGSSSSLSSISKADIHYIKLALNHAQKGVGSTWPNPAVGCVLVRQDSGEVIGSGFHPRAGFPHAEVFALLEATGHIVDGVAAAETVVACHSNKWGKRDEHSSLKNGRELETIQQLTSIYSSQNGSEVLFSDGAFTDPVTAYVTLEPCCHYGKTPPCAASLVLVKVSRVVVGFGDPNPCVAGGGVKMMKDSNIEVDMMIDSEDDDAALVHKACADIVADFVKRITPSSMREYSYVTGAMRRNLRSLAERKKLEGTLPQMEWTGETIEPTTDEADVETLVGNLELDPMLLERADHALWQNELLLLRLNKAIKKKKGAKILGERVAEELEAHVTQTKGHTVLLYRPGIPPIIDLDKLGASSTHEE